jgi:thymidine kinase
MNANNLLSIPILNTEPKFTNSYLEIFMGPMFSSKTNTIIEIYKKCIYCHIPVVVINHSFDVRYSTSNVLSTHDGTTIPCIPTSRIGNLLKKVYYHRFQIMLADVILINEAQFFPDLFDLVIFFLKRNKKVYLCGLDGDYRRNKIGQILDLIPYADKVTKLNSFCSICRNGTPGIFSMRKTREKEVIVIGGEDIYETVCRNCYETSYIEEEKLNIELEIE